MHEVCRRHKLLHPCAPLRVCNLQFQFEVCGLLLLGATLLERLCVHFEDRLAGLKIAPPMIGMCLGWSFGNAAVKTTTPM